MNFKQFLMEALSEDDKSSRLEIKHRIEKLGYHEFKDDRATSSFIKILSDDDRQEVLDKILDEFEDKEAERDVDIKGSSIGGVKIGKISVIVKPKSKQGVSSAGKSNEDFFVNSVNLYASKESPITVKIKSQKVVIKTIENVIECKDTSLSTGDRSKADVELLLQNGDSIGISIKKKNAEFWESPVKYFRMEAIKILEKLLDDNKIELEHLSGQNFKIKPEVAIKATKQEVEDVVFGNDLKNGKGFVIKQTFTKNDFDFDDEKGILTIDCYKLYEDYNDVKENDIHFIIINKTNRPDFSIMRNKYTNDLPCRGLYLKAADNSRVSSKAIVIENRNNI